MTEQEHRRLFALLVEVVAKGLEFNELCQDAYKALLTHYVVEAGGSMDNEELVAGCEDMLCAVINKNAVERREFLASQAS